MLARIKRVRERSEWALNVLDVSRRMGAEWVVFRFRYALERKLGVHRRRSPERPWPKAAGRLVELPAVVDHEGLKSWLLKNASEHQRACSTQLVADLHERRFDVFGTQVDLPSWHHDPIHEVVYDSSAHWTQVPEFHQTDVKCVWEPSRFGWAFGLARAELLGIDGASDLFWDLLEDWMQGNQPNRGINWSCGQESSIRLMAVLLSAMAMPHSLSRDRLAAIEQLIEVTADRVQANIGYARSQRNNHQASEAVALVVAGLIMPSHPNAKGWLAVGERHLDEVCRKLILSDGGSSQYSTNYHRVFLHNFVWVAQVAEACRHDLGETFNDAMRRASDYLINFMEPRSGHGPFIGHDDGAELLPRFFQPHRLLGPDVQLLRAYHDMPKAVGPDEWDEWLAWFGLEFATGAPVGWSDEPGYLHYPKMGIVIMWAGVHRVYVRCGPFDFRPSQADQLHVDVWEDGVNTIGDPGTFSYNPRPGEPGLLDSAFDHNTITINGQDHMPKVGRFLFARWTEGEVDELALRAEGVRVACRLTTARGTVRRVVDVRAVAVQTQPNREGARRATSTLSYRRLGKTVDLLESHKQPEHDCGA